MGRKTKYMREQVEEELRALDVKSYEFGLTKGHHQVVSISIGGDTKRVFFGSTPSDPRAAKNARRDVRHIVRDLRDRSTT